MNRQELNLIHQIADRAVALYQRLDAIEARNERFARSGIIHELLTVHQEIVPLRLAELLTARDSDFLHDIAGIHQHLDNGKTPRFNDCFTPRCANETQGVTE